jgi:hypothetical protein
MRRLVAGILVILAATVVAALELSLSRSVPPQDDVRVQQVVATVSAIDRHQGQALHLASDLLGIFGARVVVTPETIIERAGRHATLEDLREGMLVDVTFERRPLEKVARSVRVLYSTSALAPPGQ